MKPPPLLLREARRLGALADGLVRLGRRAEMALPPEGEGRAGELMTAAEPVLRGPPSFSGSPGGASMELWSLFRPCPGGAWAGLGRRGRSVPLAAVEAPGTAQAFMAISGRGLLPSGRGLGPGWTGALAGMAAPALGAGEAGALWLVVLRGAERLPAEVLLEG